MVYKLLKYPKYLVLFLVGVALGIGFLLWYPSSTSYYSSCAVTYSEFNIPKIKVELQDSNYELKVSIGTRFPLFLNKEILDKIDKQPQGTTLWHNIKGEQFEALTYLIPKMKVGELTLTNILVNQSLEQGHNSIGKYLGEEFNLLLDFPHSRIVACDTFSRLQARELAGNHWVPVPFELNRIGVVLLVKTVLGTHRLAINTTSTFNALRSSLAPSEKSLISSNFSIGDVEFGKTSFQVVDLPEILNDIDGCIGMDFLKDHALYIDYSNKIAYIEPPPIYFARLPVIFGRCNTPEINVTIEENTYPLRVDLGAFFSFSLSQEILQNIHKASYGTTMWADFKGNKYESPTYTIPEIKIGNLTVVNVLTKQENVDFNAVTSNGPPPSESFGSIGLPILEKYNLFLDFPHSAIYASNSHLHLQQAGLLSKNLLIIPFVLHQDGILISVETDLGTQRLILDTGASHVVIRPPHTPSTSKFRIMDHDFGARTILDLDVSPRDDYEGYLGMAFLREFPLFIDYPNKLIYLDLGLDKVD